MKVNSALWAGNTMAFSDVPLQAHAIVALLRRLQSKEQGVTCEDVGAAILRFGAMVGPNRAAEVVSQLGGS